jgi:precorrin-6B methylase 2
MADWDAEAARFDEEPDHGLRDPEVRACWRTLLLSALPPAPARVADLGAGTGSITGAGLSAARCADLVAAHRDDVTVHPLGDPRLWGRPITDERYLLVSRS